MGTDALAGGTLKCEGTATPRCGSDIGQAAGNADVGRRLDALVVRTVPGVRKPSGESPFYVSKARVVSQRSLLR